MLQTDVVVPPHSVALLGLPRTEATAQHFPFLKSCIPSKVPFGVLGFLFVCLFFNLFIYLFIYLWLCWVFTSVRGLSLVAASGGRSSSRCAGLSSSRPFLLWSTGSRRAGSAIVAHGPSRSAACGILPDQATREAPGCWVLIVAT